MISREAPEKMELLEPMAKEVKKELLVRLDIGDTLDHLVNQVDQDYLESREQRGPLEKG